MNFNNIIEELADGSNEKFEQVSHRRDILKGVGTKLAMAAIPFAAASLFTNKSYGQSKETIVNILNYLLKGECISRKFYAEAKKVDGLLPEGYSSHFEQISWHVQTHIDALKQLISELGGAAVEIDDAKIDLNGNKGLGGGPFSNALIATKDFLVMMQVLSDTAERVYNGQTFRVLSDKITLATLMKIHTVKTRHAVFARNLRRTVVYDPVKPWITGTNSDTANPAAQRTYAGESNTKQLGMEVVGINGYLINADAATQAFDEPLSMTDGNNILDRFVQLV